jgi:phosphate starvation-inducible membrane PsiE
MQSLEFLALLVSFMSVVVATIWHVKSRVAQVGLIFITLALCLLAAKAIGMKSLEHGQLAAVHENMVNDWYLVGTIVLFFGIFPWIGLWLHKKGWL